ncbi:hypothetical protein CCP3SC1_400029 [Gammaproteobacteria bacterium]
MHSEQPNVVATDDGLRLPTSRRLAFLFSFAALILFVTVYLIFDTQKRDIRAHVEHNLANIATLKAEQIRLWLKERMDDAAIFTNLRVG